MVNSTSRSRRSIPILRLLGNMLNHLRARRLQSALVTVLAAAPFVVHAESLPVPCSACGPGGTRFAAPGVASVLTRGNTLTVTQKPARAVLNWQSFDIAKGKTVEFKQPSSNAIALNRIHQNSPSEIFGNLNANGQIYLINQNGIVFGRSARVDTNSLVASSLDMDDAVFANLGIAGAINDPTGAKAAFAGHGALGAVTVAPGAELRSAEGGRILLLAPQVKNGGSIETPGGQAIAAAAKDKVYLAAADGDPNLRGLIVEVENGGTVTNTGTISAPRGNVTLLGYAVNQQGLASATTSVSVNGSVRLLARDHVQVVRNDVKNTSVPTALHGGVLTLGPASRTEVTPVAASTDPNPAKAREADRNLREAVDSQPQVLSKIELFGNKVTAQGGADIRARGGDISIKAQRNATPAPGETAAADLEIEKGTRIDAAGSREAQVSLSRNLVTVELRGNELRDAPLQKNGLLRGESVTFDVRKGTPLADVSGAVAAIRRSLDERLAPGGSINIDSDDNLVIARGAALDVSGGVVEYAGGFVNTTKLISGGRLFDISQADPGRVYDGIFGSAERVHRKWGVVENYALFSNAQASFEPGYREGKDAGSLTLAAPVLNVAGQMQGGVVVDDFQRNSPGALAGFQRAYDERPLAGRLILGRGSIEFDDGVAQNYLLDDVCLDVDVASGANTVVTATGTRLDVSPAVFSDGGFDRAEIFANGRVTLARGTALELGAFGQFNVGAGAIEIAGSVKSAAGQIAMNAIPTVRIGNDATALTLAPGSELNTEGRWVNERAARALNQNTTQGPLALDGGEVSLLAIGTLDLQRGSVIDVGAGGLKNSKGSLEAGEGGRIALSSDDVVPTRFNVAGELRGFAFAKGAQLELSGGGFAIQQDASAHDNLTLLSPALFSAQGFASIEINASREGITVAPGTVLDLRQRNRLESKALATAPTGTDVDAISAPAYLDDAERRPTQLALNFKRRANVPETRAEVSIGSGATLRADPESTISLSSDTRLFIDGVIAAPAGRISLAVVNPRDGNDRGFDASQAIRLGSHAALLAPGALRSTPDALGLRLGEALAGGRVSLSAQRGYVLTQQGSRIDVSGITTVFDLIDPAQPAHRVPTTVRAVGGDILMSAAEGMQLNGSLRGRQGGRLSLAINPLDRETSADLTGLPQFPTTPRSIVVGGAAAADVPRDAVIPDAMNGQLNLPGAELRAGGFAALDLSTRPVLTGTDIDSVRFVGTQTLTLSQSLTLDTSVLATDGGAVRLNAPYVRLGSSNDLFRRSATASVGSGTLEVRAEHIDLIGDTTLQGFGDDVALHSAGDLRLLGTRVPANSSTSLVGSFKTSGDVEFDAARIYPSTLSSYTLTSSGSDATVTIAGGQTQPALPLSAGGSLTIDAANIVHDGALLAPFGQLTLDARDSLTLGAHSLTSATGADLLVPFGQTQFGRQWTYPLDVVTRLIESMPAKRITFSAADVTLAPGAVVDVRGGGDLLATEHIPGPGGSTDILAAGNSGGAFAIVPSLDSRFAPVDPLETPAFGFRPDSTIEIAASDALPAGRYAVLPAHYAVLPGALLLTPADGASDIVPGLRGQTSDSLPLVAGRFGSAGGAVSDTTWQGYRVESGTDWRLRGEYRETRASDFFTTGNRSDDAGALSLSARNTLVLAGRLLAGTPAGGRGAEMDIAAEHLAVVERLSGHSGRVEIRAADLNAFGAQSLLLGGQRRATTNETAIDVVASDVTIAAGASLELPELMMVARDDIVLDSGARVSARGATVTHRTPLALTGDNALLIASTGSQAVVKHSGQSGVAGSVTLRAGAELFASGSLALDGSRNTGVAGTLRTDGGSLRLASSRISLGDVAGVTDGLALTSARLRGLAADELILDSRSSLDLYGPLTADIANLVINAAGIIGHDNGGDAVTLRADSIVLSNPNARSDASAIGVVDAAGASLALNAREINIGRGAFALAGFADVSLNASADIIGRGRSSLVSSGDVTLRAARLGTTSGATLALGAEHAVFRTAAGTAGLPPTSSLGGHLTVSAEDIDFAGNIVLPAGTVEFTASGAGGVQVRDGAVIDVAARREVFGGQQVGVRGGAIALVAEQGDIALGAGAELDVSARGASSAGSIRLEAGAGSIRLDAAVELRGTGQQRGGAWLLDAGALAAGTDFSALNATLNAAGFNGARSFRVRSGDLTLARNAAVIAHDVRLTADAGAIDILGHIDAHGVEAGRITLSARDDVSLRGSARLDASASGAGQLGGVVKITTTQGQLNLAATDRAGAAGIDVAGTHNDSRAARDNGHVLLRAPRLADSDVAVSDAAITVTGAERIDLEAFKAYSGTNVTTVFNTAHSEADAFMTTAPAIEARLARDADPRFHVLPGIEITSTGNLTLSSTLDLLTRRYDGEAGVLTLRARGDLLLNASLSDGIAFQTYIDPASGEEFAELGERDHVQSGPSWSYNLSAGADLDSADLNATRAGGGDLVLAANRRVRTGTGSIAIATGGELRLAGSGSAIYTVGETRGTGSFDAILTEGLMRGDYLTRGGNIDIDAEAGVRGVASKVLPDWLARIGGANIQVGETVPTAWTVNAGAFTQGIGALGGGAVSISSAGDITDLTVAIPTTAQPNGAALSIDGGGILDIDVGGSIRSGAFLLGRGVARLNAGGDIVKSSAAPIATVLELGDGQFELTAGGKLTLESIFNPTLTPLAPSQSVDAFGSASAVYFSTYTERSAVSLTAIDGDVVLENRNGGIRAPYGDRNFASGDIMALTLAPATLEARSLRRNVQLNNSLILAPSAEGQLALLAAGSLVTPNVQTRIRLTDTDPLLIPSVTRPSDNLVGLPDALLSDVPGIGHGATPLHLGDADRASIIARAGDIGSSNGNRLEITLAKQALIEAGRDIINLSYNGQHVSTRDHSVVQAGRDVLFSTLRNPLGVLQVNQSRFEFNGPGQFDVLAGRDVDLGTSDGLLSTGQLRNPALAEGDGSLTVMAGMASAPDYAAFVQRYLRKGRDYDAQLRAFVLAQGDATRATALVSQPTAAQSKVLAQFEALPPATQRQFITTVFFSEIKEAGISASKPGETASDYTRGFTAIETLFPQRGRGGDIISLLSRIQTLDGGDINLLAPYGLVNAGAAAVTGLAKTPDQLGVVIQRSGDLNAFTAGDFLVNSSRVFALDGGSILIWSSRGNIDAGRGAKSALSIPPPVVSFDALGNVITEFPPAVSGSGIQAAVSSAGRAPGNVFLFAPGGIVDAGDAGITSAGNLTIAATAVLGADNISVGGSAVGVPTAAVSVPVGLAGASAAAGGASNAAANAASDSFNGAASATQDLGKTMVSVISVEFLGFGE